MSTQNLRFSSFRRRHHCKTQGTAFSPQKCSRRNTIRRSNAKSERSTNSLKISDFQEKVLRLFCFPLGTAYKMNRGFAPKGPLHVQHPLFAALRWENLCRKFYATASHRLPRRPLARAVSLLRRADGFSTLRSFAVRQQSQTFPNAAPLCGSVFLPLAGLLALRAAGLRPAFRSISQLCRALGS